VTTSDRHRGARRGPVTATVPVRRPVTGTAPVRGREEGVP